MDAAKPGDAGNEAGRVARDHLATLSTSYKGPVCMSVPTLSPYPNWLFIPQSSPLELSVHWLPGKDVIAL